MVLQLDSSSRGCFYLEHGSAEESTSGGVVSMLVVIVGF